MCCISCALNAAKPASPARAYLTQLTEVKFHFRNVIPPWPPLIVFSRSINFPRHCLTTWSVEQEAEDVDTRWATCAVPGFILNGHEFLLGSTRLSYLYNIIWNNFIDATPIRKAEESCALSIRLIYSLMAAPRVIIDHCRSPDSRGEFIISGT